MDLIFTTSSTTSTSCMSHSTLEILIFTWSHTLSTISDLDHLFLFFFLFFLFFTKPSVEMIATLCNNHLTSRSLLSELVAFSKPYCFFFSKFNSKATSSFIKSFQIIFSNKIGNESGTLDHLISTQKYFIYNYSLFYFVFTKMHVIIHAFSCTLLYQIILEKVPLSFIVL
jgi:hypothetical protein